MPGPRLKYYGLSSFSIETGDMSILVDPWIEGPEWSIRTVEDFDDLDYIFVTHGAPDHLGETYQIAHRTGARVVTEPAVADHLVDRGLPAEQVHRMIWGNVYTGNHFSVKALETHHLSYFESETETLSGLPLGFHFDFGTVGLYNVGDTSIFSDIELFVQRYDPDVVLLPIGSAPGHMAPMPPDDAAHVATWLEGRTVIPIHYTPGSDELSSFRDHVSQAPASGPTIEVLDVGDTVRLSTVLSS